VTGVVGNSYDPINLSQSPLTGFSGFNPSLKAGVMEIKPEQGFSPS